MRSSNNRMNVRLLAQSGHSWRAFSTSRASPGGRERLSERDLYRPAQLGGESVSQAHSLQQASQRHSLCRVGTAAILFRGSSRWFQTIAQTDLKISARSCAPRLLASNETATSVGAPEVAPTVAEIQVTSGTFLMVGE